MHIDAEDMAYYAQCREEAQTAYTKKQERLRRRIRASFLRGDLVLALPAGKSLEKRTIELLHAAGIEVTRSHPRACVATLTGILWCSRAAFCKPADMPGLLSNASIAVGIGGMDYHHETQCGDSVGICAELNYNRMTRGRMRAVLFARADDRIRTIDDLERRFAGRKEPLDIVSEYERETERFLAEHDMRGLVTPSRGSSEVLVRLGIHRFGVALVETGDTLRVNHLCEVATIFESTTAFMASRLLLDIPEAAAAIAELSRRLAAALEDMTRS